MKKTLLTIVIALLNAFVSIAQDTLDIPVHPQNSSAVNKLKCSHSNLKNGANSASIINVIPSPNQFSIVDIAFDGQYLWVEGHNEYFLHQISPVDGTIIKSIPTNVQSPVGLTFDGNNLWLADAYNKIIQKIDTLDGSVLLSFQTPADTSQSFPQGLTWDGNYLWHNDVKNSNAFGAIDSIFQIDTNGVLNDSYHHFLDAPSGLAFDGTHLWSSDNFTHNLYKIDINTLLPLDSIEAPGGNYPNGLAFDGQYLWVSNNDADSIYQIDIDFISSVSISYPASKALKIYPNPTSNNLTISSEHSGISQIVVYDITGAVVKRYHPSRRTINVADLPSGIYFIRLITDDRTIIESFVKQ